MSIKKDKPSQFLSIFIIISLLSIHLANALFSNNQNFNFANFLIFLFSLGIVSFSVRSIKDNGINAFNIFFFLFFFFLMMNTFNISNLQSAKTSLDMYYYFVGPLIFGGCLYIAEKQHVAKIRNSGMNVLNPNKLVIIGLLVYITIRTYIFSITGIRLLSDHTIIGQSDLYVLPGFSGVAALLFWSLLMYVPHINKSLQLLVVSSGILFEGVLLFKRGDIIRPLVFVFIYYVLTKGAQLRRGKNYIRVLLLVLVAILVFSYAGDYRQVERGGYGGANWNVSELLQSNIGIASVDWIYSYTALNFDVLSQGLQREPNYSIEAIFVPLFRLFKGNEALLGYYSGREVIALSGFNAGTFLREYIIDLGLLYFIEVFLLGIVVGCAIVFSKKFYFIGVYVFVLFLTALTVFGDYYTAPNYFWSVIISFVFLLFTKLPDVSKQQNLW